MSSFPWRTLCFVSLALNLLVLGGIGGALGAGARLQREEPDAAVVERIPGIRAFIAAVPVEARSQLRQQLGESWRETRDLRRAARDARRESFAAIAAEPYDDERVRAALAGMRVADQALVGAFHENMTAFLSELTPEQRRDVLERLRRAPRAARQGSAPGLDGEEAAPRDRVLSPEERERLRERRQERRERRQQGGAQ